MNYTVAINKQVIKTLEGINEPYYTKIKTAIYALGTNPRPTGYKKLKGREAAYRIRVADYRIIYEILDQFLLVKIIDAGHRKNIYQ